MLADVPHGEAIVPAAGNPAPSFYVSESRDLPLDVIDLRKYRLRVGS
ncbi:MAG: hypothetical protein OXQ31_24395 [Spirochaetaceae bacterium]|nr:hypothetical protein [Spirochaetaceae bacterium]